MYAYLMLPDSTQSTEIMNDFCFEQQRIFVRTRPGDEVPGGLGVVCRNIFHKFSPKSTADFGKINSKKAYLSFPGQKYSSLNFSGLVGIPQAYFLITNKKIEDMLDSETTNALDLNVVSNKTAASYCLVKVGDPNSADGNPAFMGPPLVTGLVAKIPGKPGTFSTFPASRAYSDELYSTLSDFDMSFTDKDVGPISCASDISDLVIIAEGAKNFEVSRRYKFFFNNKRLKKSIFRRVRSISGAQGESPVVVGRFKNISINGEGNLPVSVTHRSKKFHLTYGSSLYVRKTLTASNSDNDLPSHQKLNSGKYKILPPDGETNSRITEVLSAGGLMLAQERTVLLPKNGTQWSRKHNEIMSQSRRWNSPINLRPQGGISLLHGLLLGDSDEEKGMELFEIDRFGLLRPQGTLSALASARGAREAAERLQATASQLQAQALALADDASSLGPEALALFEQAQDDANQAQAAADEARNQAERMEAQNAKAAGEEEIEVSEDDIAKYTDVDGGAGAVGTGAVEAVGDAVDSAIDSVNGAIEEVQGVIDDIAAFFKMFTDLLSSAAGLLNMLGDAAEDAVNQAAAPYTDRDPNIYFADKREIYLPANTELGPGGLIFDTNETIIPTTDTSSFAVRIPITTFVDQGSSILCNVPRIVRIRRVGTTEWYGEGQGEGRDFGSFSCAIKSKVEMDIENAKRDVKLEIGGKRIKKRKVSFSGKNDLEPGLMRVNFMVPENLQALNLFGSDPCLKISASNTNANYMKLGRTVGNGFAIDLEKKSKQKLFGALRKKTPDIPEMIDRFKKFALRGPGGVLMDGIAAAKEHMQSFCDLSFYATVQLDLSLRNFKYILIPIKIILCIIDVICALLNPWKLASAVVRLFFCLFDLLLLLPQISVPVMFLALILHLLELLQCVLIKIITTITAINEIIAALDTAIEQKNFPAIMALEETLNEHILSIEGDLSALTPILQIIALFLELLQLLFSFPCRVAEETLNPTCIDPSLLAGILIGKAAPEQIMAPDNLLPLAQSYSKLKIENVGPDGNTPPDTRDDGSTVENASGGNASNDILKEASENTGKVVMVRDGFNDDGSERSFLETTEVNPQSLRTKGEEYAASFAISCTKSKKGFAVFTGPDPRIVEFVFKERGKTSTFAWTPFINIFFRKKTIDDIAPLDSPPRFLNKSGDSIKVAGSGSDLTKGFVSPIDGENNFLQKGGSGYHPKPLTVTLIEKQPTGEVDDAGQPVFEDIEYQQTFDGIPMVAIIDEEFNVYFIEDNGIVVEGGEIVSIKAKMINLPSAPKLRLSKEDREVFRNVDGVPGEKIVKEQANADYIIANDPLDEGFDEDSQDDDKVSKSKAVIESDYPDAPYPDSGSYNYNTKRADRKKLEAAIDSIKVFDFPQLYFIDVRQAADELASACNASALNNLLLSFALGDVDFPAEDGSPDVAPADPTPADIIEEMGECLEEFMGKIRNRMSGLSSKLAQGNISLNDQIDIFEIREEQQEVEECARAAIDKICLFVVNPLNTGFKLLEDDDNTPLPGYINPEEVGRSGAELGPGAGGLYDTDGDGILSPLEAASAATGVELTEEDLLSTLFRDVDVDDENSQVVQAAGDTIIVLGKKPVVKVDRVYNQTTKEIYTITSNNIDINTGLNEVGEVSIAGSVLPQEGDVLKVDYTWRYFFDENDRDIEDLFDEDFEIENHRITGAREYAAGIGDMATVPINRFATIEIIPRDSYDAVIAPGISMFLEKIKVDIIEDEAGSAELVEIEDPNFEVSESKLIAYDEQNDRYLARVKCNDVGRVTLRGSVCKKTIRAVNLAGLKRVSDSEEDKSREEELGVVDCIPDAGDSMASEDSADTEVFAPGQLTKIDRILTIVFKPAGASDSDEDGIMGLADAQDVRDESAESAKAKPQGFGSDLEN